MTAAWAPKQSQGPAGATTQGSQIQPPRSQSDPSVVTPLPLSAWGRYRRELCRGRRPFNLRTQDTVRERDDCHVSKSPLHTQRWAQRSHRGRVHITTPDRPGHEGTASRPAPPNLVARVPDGPRGLARGGDLWLRAAPPRGHRRLRGREGGGAGRRRRRPASWGPWGGRGSWRVWAEGTAVPPRAFACS